MVGNIISTVARNFQYYVRGKLESSEEFKTTEKKTLDTDYYVIGN